jgi:O-antigen/teichoic acid export membrane protein/thymidylate kinase
MTRSVPLPGDEGVVARLSSHVRTPLFGSAYALILSSASTSALGLLYWTLAARLYDASIVGVNAAAISTMTFISYLAQLNMAGALTRFIPAAGPATGRLIVRAYVAATLLSGVAATVFVLVLAGLTSPALALLDQPIGAGWFVLATMAWSLFALQDGALTGLRRTAWVPVENIVFAITKIVLLVLFVGSAAVASGIFASWTIPAALLLVPVNVAIFRRFVPRHPDLGPGAGREIRLGAILPFLAGDYAGSLFTSAAVGLLPLIVLSVVGASASAYFFVGWTIAYSLQLVSINMATSLMVEGSARRERLAADSRRMTILLLRLQVPAVAAVFLLAPIILHIFGEEYAKETESLLRILALAVIPHGLNAIYLAVARVRRQVGRIVLVQGTLAGLVLSLSVMLLPELGITGVGVAWLAAQSVVAVVVVGTQLRPLWSRPRPVVDPFSGLVGEAAPEGTSFLEHVLGGLTAAGLRFALLRTDSPGTSAGDIDLVVAPSDVDRMADGLLGAGFLELPSQGRGTHRFFLARDPRTGAWIELDLVSELAYGRFFELRTGLAEAVLDRRLQGVPVSRLDPDDAFWTLMLHTLLDKRAVSPAHAARLQALATHARSDGPLGGFVLSLLPERCDLERVRATVDRGEWPDLVALGRPIRAAWRRLDGIGVTSRYIWGVSQRLAEPFVLLARRRGVSVALLGPDGAGKSSLAEAIMADSRLPVRLVYMGMWKADGSRIPGLALLRRPISVWRRYLVALFHVTAGRIVIFDRYTYDATIPPHGPLTWLKRPYFWLLAHAIPAPDLVFVLDVPGPLLYARKGEYDADRLEAERRHFSALAGRLRNAILVDATRSPDAVLSAVSERIWRRYATGAPIPSGPTGPSRMQRLMTRAAISGSRARRSIADRRPLARDLRSLPAILASLPADPTAFRDGWAVLTAGRTETGVTVAFLGPQAGDARLVVKIASASEGEMLSAHARQIATLRADERLAGWSDLLPTVVGNGRSGSRVFVAEGALPGLPAERLIRDPAIRAVLLPTAGSAIGELHRRTMRRSEVDADLMDAWVHAPIRQLAMILGRRDDGGSGLRRLAALGDRLVERLDGRTMEVSWIHGDYWPGNLLATADGRRVTGIVDWDQASDGFPPIQDVIHLLLYARRLCDGRELGDVVRGFLGTERLDDVELAAVAAAGTTWPSLEEVRLATALAWLRHVGSFVGLPGHGSNALWVQRNVDAVLHDLSPERPSGRAAGQSSGPFSLPAEKSVG